MKTIFIVILHQLNQNLSYMKKLILFIGLLIWMATPIWGAKESVKVTISIKGNRTQNTTIQRSLIQLPIEVEYDSETRTIEINSDDEFDAQTYLTDENGKTLASSTTLNTVLLVPSDYSGILLIYIETEDWTATGEIEI